VEIAHLIEAASSTAFADLYHAAPLALKDSLGLSLLNHPSITAIRCERWNTTHINRVFNLGMTQAATEADLDALEAFYQEIGFSIALSPTSQPSDLPHRLAQRGFVTTHATPVMCYRSIPFFQAQRRTEKITPAEADTFAALLVESFPLPTFFRSWLAATVGFKGWHHYFAYKDDTPIGAASMIVHRQVALLNWSATAEAYRRLGAHRALIQRRIQDAYASGCTVIAVDTDEVGGDSYRNLANLGFELVYLRPDYVLQPSDR
jgi:GNAT superfamily N-acetyltransferase